MKKRKKKESEKRRKGKKRKKKREGRKSGGRKGKRRRRKGTLEHNWRRQREDLGCLMIIASINRLRFVASARLRAPLRERCAS